MLMPASEAWKQVEELVANDIAKIQKAVTEAIQAKKSYAGINVQWMESDVVQSLCNQKGYRWVPSELGSRYGKLYFSPKEADN